MRSCSTTIAWSAPPTDRAWWRRPRLPRSGASMPGRGSSVRFAASRCRRSRKRSRSAPSSASASTSRSSRAPGGSGKRRRPTMKALLELWPRSMPAPLISSFAPACLRVAHEMAPEMPRGYLAGTLPRRWRQLMAQYGCATLHLNHRRIVPWQRATVLAAGVPWCCIRSTTAYARGGIEAGVAAVITDRIDRVLSFLDQNPDRPDPDLRCGRVLGVGRRPASAGQNSQ